MIALCPGIEATPVFSSDDAGYLPDEPCHAFAPLDWLMGMDRTHAVYEPLSPFCDWLRNP